MNSAAQPLPPARWAVEEKDGVLMLRSAGVVTLESQMACRGALLQAVERTRPGAVLVDLRSAVLLLTPNQWGEMARPEFWQSARVDLPIAYVVTPAIAEQAATYCAEMMGHGLLRLVFSQIEPAFDWCVAHARAARGQMTAA